LAHHANELNSDISLRSPEKTPCSPNSQETWSTLGGSYITWGDGWVRLVLTRWSVRTDQHLHRLLGGKEALVLIWDNALPGTQAGRFAAG
jgi:hypothetical protein